ncbi:alpha/beta fold hydrolase [Hwanghaeella sp.]|uniref:alpha/beta fold hydrolase n=1 Tax=Hwanghaeella sp. TaxID=2605943 RepID=UPI003CCB87E9
MFLPKENRRLYFDLLGPEGAAQTVCLAHSLTADSSMWAEQVPELLASGYRVLRVDMRGHGASETVFGDYTMDELADDAAHVITALDIGPVDFVGLSIGGMLGQSLALRYPDLIRSALFADTLPASVPAAESVWIERKRTVQDAQSLAPLAESTMARWLTAEFREKRPGRWRQIFESILVTDVAGFLGCVHAVRSFDFTGRLGELKPPALVVCGANDQGTPASENRRMSEMIPGGKYVEIADCQHFPNVERPDEFNRILIDWLNRS